MGLGPGGHGRHRAPFSVRDSKGGSECWGPARRASVKGTRVDSDHGGSQPSHENKKPPTQASADELTGQQMKQRSKGSSAAESPLPDDTQTTAPEHRRPAAAIPAPGSGGTWPRQRRPGRCWGATGTSTVPGISPQEPAQLQTEGRQLRAEARSASSTMGPESAPPQTGQGDAPRTLGRDMLNIQVTAVGSGPRGITGI